MSAAKRRYLTQKLLKQDLDSLLKTKKYLEYSFEKTKNFDFDSELSMNDLEVMDSLSSRFMRCYEVLVNQILKTSLILMNELMETKIDNLNQAEKFQFFESFDTMEDIRIVRNQIAHEYVNEEWKVIYKKLTRLTPCLLSDVNNTIEQIEKRGLLKMNDEHI